MSAETFVRWFEEMPDSGVRKLKLFFGGFVVFVVVGVWFFFVYLGEMRQAADSARAEEARRKTETRTSKREKEQRLLSKWRQERSGVGLPH